MRDGGHSSINTWCATVFGWTLEEYIVPEELYAQGSTAATFLQTDTSICRENKVLPVTTVKVVVPLADMESL